MSHIFDRDSYKEGYEEGKRETVDDLNTLLSRVKTYLEKSLPTHISVGGDADRKDLLTSLGKFHENR